MVTMKIRQFRSADASACAELMKKNERFLGEIFAPEGLIEAAKSSHFWVAETGGRILGFAGLTNLHNGIGMGISVCVDPEAQGQGVGTKLIQRLKVVAKREKYRKVLLLINAKNKKMMCLAIKEDFVPEGSLQKHFRTGEDVIYFSYFV